MERIHIIRLIDRRWLTDEIFELRLTRPTGFRFLPGQHIRFHHHGIERDYTLISIPENVEIEICVKRKISSADDPIHFSTYLSRCAIGEPFNISGPYGHFFYHPTKRTEVFIGTGTGVAPFVSFSRSKVWKWGGIFLQGARNEDGLIYGDLLSGTSERYVPCLSEMTDSAPKRFFSGRVTHYLKKNLPKGRYQFYICGKREMILDAMVIIDEWFSDAKVFTEWFT